MKRRLRPMNLCVFHGGRVGSTVVGDLLHQHPGVHWGGEVLWRATRAARQAADPENFRPPQCPWREIREASARGGLRRFGMEIKYEHLRLFRITPADMIAQLERMGFGHFVIQHRRNLLRQFVSAQLNIARNRWRLKVGETVERMKVRVEPEDLQRYFRWQRESTAQVRAALRGNPTIEVIYEDHVERDPRVPYRMLCEFMGIKPASPQVRDRRMNPDPLPELIENHDEVVAALTGTDDAWMLQDAAPVQA